MPKRLEEVGIGTDRLADMARHIAQTEGLEHAWVPLSEQDILHILKNCLWCATIRQDQPCADRRDKCRKIEQDGIIIVQEGKPENSACLR